MNSTITTAAQWNTLDVASYRRPDRVHGVLMCEPTAFDVVDVRNAHMNNSIGSVDRAAAAREWQLLVDAFEREGLRVATVPSDPKLVDMVFTANPCFTGLDVHGEPFVVMSRMRHRERTDEVDHHRKWFARSGVKIIELPDEFSGAWEGGGDTVWHPGHAILWGGYGERSDATVYPALAEKLGVPIAVLELVDSNFYHLDTCLAAIREGCAAWIPSAFSSTSRALLQCAFSELIEVDSREAAERLAGNLFCPNGSTVFLPSGSPVTRSRLEGKGLNVVEVTTDEYLKSGGSVYCMRQNLYGAD